MGRELQIALHRQIPGLGQIEAVVEQSELIGGGCPGETLFQLSEGMGVVACPKVTAFTHVDFHGTAAHYVQCSRAAAVHDLVRDPIAAQYTRRDWNVPRARLFRSLIETEPALPQ